MGSVGEIIEGDFGAGIIWIGNLDRVYLRSQVNFSAVAQCVKRAIKIATKLPEIARSHPLREKLGARGSGVQVAEALIVSKEEELVLNYRTANRDAKLVVTEFWFQETSVSGVARNRLPGNVLIGNHAFSPAIRGFIGIQFVVPPEFVHAAVKAIRAGLG